MKRLCIRCLRRFLPRILPRSTRPAAQYPEIMRKNKRPHACLVIETRLYSICVPFRSRITHNNAFLFTHTARAGRTRSGLDYGKLVLIEDETYIDTASPAIVDQDEYAAMRSNLDRIVREVVAYIEAYALHVQGTAVLPPREYARRYRYSTLPYFHPILRLP